MEETTTTDNPFEENQPSNQGVKWLLTHAWNIISKEPWTKGRLSRGEYWISILLLSLISGLMSLIVSQFGSIGIGISSIIGLISGIRGIGMIIRRSHDLNQNGWYYFKPSLSLMILGLVWLVSSILLSGGLKSIINRIAGLAALTLLVRTLIVAIKTLFVKGTPGENIYGIDRIPAQPKSNIMYWGIGITLMVLGIIFDAATPGKQLQNDAFEQIIQQRIGSQINNTTDYPQINIDDSMSDADIADQIDTAVQEEDTAALVESETVDNTTTETSGTIN